MIPTRPCLYCSEVHLLRSVHNKTKSLHKEHSEIILNPRVTKFIHCQLTFSSVRDGQVPFYRGAIRCDGSQCKPRAKATDEGLAWCCKG